MKATKQHPTSRKHVLCIQTSIQPSARTGRLECCVKQLLCATAEVVVFQRWIITTYALEGSQG